MILQDPSELRLYFPAHAIDSIDPFVGVLDNSEHDFLQDKLGTPLYHALCDWYAANTPSSVDTEQTGYYNRLLLLSQRCIAYDAMARAIGMHIISINNAGVNISTAQDYDKVDLEAIGTFKNTCIKEAHSAVNRLLQTLEEWTQYAAASEGPDDELKAIVGYWRQSRYFYLAASLLIPSARVLQDYLNFYESREKFIQMLPDLRYIQEEIIAPAIGEDLCDYIVAFSQGASPVAPESSEQSEPSESPTSQPVPSAAVSQQSSPSSVEQKALHRLRKVMASMLEERTPVLKLDKTRAAHVHDESVRLLQTAIDFIKAHQQSFPLSAIETSPLYTPPITPQEPTTPTCHLHTAPTDTRHYENNRRDSAMFTTPFLN